MSGVVDLPITFGSAREIVSDFKLNSVAGRGFSPGAIGYTGLDFLDTAKITGIVVLDGSGKEINNFTLVAESGHNYLSSVPIPGAIFLLGPGLVGLAAIRRRFKK